MTTPTKIEDAPEGVTLSLDGMIKTPAADCQFQVRTLGIPRPKFFYFEPTKVLRKDTKPEQPNQINKGDQQIDPRRSVSYNPIMPDLVLAKKSGNPFPADAESAKSITTSPTWAALVPLVNSVWLVMKQANGPMKQMDIVARAAKLSGLGIDAEKPGGVSDNAKKCVRDVLRDLRLYGMVLSSNTGFGRGTSWGMNPDWRKIEYTAKK